MNRDPGGLPEGPAKLEFSTPDFTVIWPGQYVLCAVTGEKIPLEQLKYWSVERQEAYRDAVAASERELQCARSSS